MSQEGITITVLSNILESQIACADYWFNAKDRHIRELLKLSQRFSDKCDILEKELKDANLRIAILMEHVTQYTADHNKRMNFSDEAPI